MAVGFTGTRKGMSTKQLATLRRFKAPWGAFHHGACDGADTEACDYFYELHWWIHAWPSHNPNAAAMAQSHTIHRPAPDIGYEPLLRNKLIVDASDLMIATPSNTKNIPRGSGTWFTIRYTRQVGKSLYIIWPNGEVGR